MDFIFTAYIVLILVFTILATILLVIHAKYNNYYSKIMGLVFISSIMVISLFYLRIT